MATQKRVLGIVGSPRRGGNTETLVDEALRGAGEAGAAMEKVVLSDLDIAPCDACDACQDSGTCVIADDMEELLDKMARSDVWVLGTPVYWWGPSAQFKTFVDRWYSKAHREEDQAMFKGRRVILVVPFGDTEIKTAQHVVGMMTDALDYVEAEFFATVLAPGVNDPGEVRKHADVLAAAYHAGKEAMQRT